MSLSAAHESKKVARVCVRCCSRKARFRYRGVVRSDRDHTLCFECYRSERDQRQARLLVQPRAPILLSPSDSRRAERQLPHRRLMLQFAEETYAARR